MKAGKMPADPRGYFGSERNRQLTPEQVIWARGAYYRNEVTTPELAQIFAMSVDSVRRMLRSETYGNVGSPLPTATAAPTPYAGGKSLDEQARESEQRMIALLQGTEAVPAPKAAEGASAKEKDEVIDRFLKGDPDPFGA